MSSFNSICHELVDAWLHSGPMGSPEALYDRALPKVSIRMALSVVVTAPDNPYDWRFRRIKDFGFKSRMLDRLRAEFPDAALHELNRSFIDDAIIPTYSRSVAVRRPTFDNVSTKLLGVRIGYERLILPQKCEGKPEWCVSLIEGRFFIPPVSEAITDLTDEGIIQLLIEGHTAKEIAELLSLSPRTIEHRIDRLKDRFQAKNLVHLVAKLVAAQLDRREQSLAL